MNLWWSLPLKAYNAEYLPNADPFFLFASDPRAPPFEYRDWLAKTSGKQGPGAYMLMYK